MNTKNSNRQIVGECVVSLLRKYRYFALTTLIILSSSILLSGCIQKRFTIEGKLLALGSQSPLRQVALRVVKLQDGTSQLAGTDDEGVYSIERLVPGKYLIASADTSKYLISPDTIVVNENGNRTQKVKPLRGLITPPAPGVYAWVSTAWREISPYRGPDDGLSITRDAANRLVTIPESASLIVWEPNHEWLGESNSVDWLMASFADSSARFIDAVLHERTPKGEPVPMDPSTFTDWKMPGVMPLRGPTLPNLYAIIVTTTLENGKQDRVLYPFWIPISAGSPRLSSAIQSAPVVTNPVITGSVSTMLQTNVNRNDTTSQATRDLFQQALNAALTAVGLKPQSGVSLSTPPNSSDSTATSQPTDTPQRSDITQDQINRWREEIRKARTDPDTFRRRQLWRAIRDSAEGTEVGYEADRLLMRDINGLPLK